MQPKSKQASVNSLKYNAQNHNSGRNTGNKFNATETESFLEFGTNRPYHKVILLAGPPGCGKTTLAHIIANHCGYRVCEVNSRYNNTYLWFLN